MQMKNGHKLVRTTDHFFNVLADEAKKRRPGCTFLCKSSNDNALQPLAQSNFPRTPQEGQIAISVHAPPSNDLASVDLIRTTSHPEVRA